MTVAELVTHLQTLPQDLKVIYRCCSDYDDLEADEIDVVLAEDKKIVKHHNLINTHRDYRSWEHKTMVPEFVSVVVFPGN